MSKKHHKKDHHGQSKPSGKAPSQPEDPRLVQGRNAFARSDYKQAIHLWERLAESKSVLPEKRAQLHGALAEAHFRLGQRLLFEDRQIALDHLIRAAELNPVDALYAYHVGLAQHRQGHIDLAIPAYKQALLRDANFVRAKLMLDLAQRQHSTVNTSQMRDLVQQSETVFGLKGGLIAVEAMQAIADENWDKAEATLKNVPLQELPLPAQGLLLYYQGVLAYRRESVDEASVLWTKAFDTGVILPALSENLTNALVVKAEADLAANKADAALALVRRGLLVSPDHNRLQDISAHLQLQLGYQAFETGNWNAVLAAGTASGQLEGRNARSALANVAIANEKLERWTDAAEAWREFARRRPRQESKEGWLTPEQVARLWERISGLYVRAGNADEAIKTLQTAIKYEPDNPKLMLALARCYADVDRTEAAQNQVDKLLMQNSADIEALVLRAELTERDPRRSFRQKEFEDDLFALPPGIPEWEAVVAQNDEAYQALAEEHLVELYSQAFDQAFYWSIAPERLKAVGERAFKILPKNHFLRAIYVQALLHMGRRERTEVEKQIALIDLSDEDALHQLVDGFHRVDDHAGAANLLEKVEASKPLGAEFYAGIGICALRRRQETIAEQYFTTALERTVSEQDRGMIPMMIGMTYLDTQQYDRAEAILRKILALDPGNGPANFILGLLADRRGDRVSAKKFLREAEKGADRVQDLSFRETVRAAKQILNTPGLSLWQMFQSAQAFSPPGGQFDFDADGELDDMDVDFYDDEDIPPINPRRRR